MSKKWLRIPMFLVPVAVGVLVVVLMVRGKAGPAKVDRVERRRTVRAILVEKQDVVPRAIGYGTVEPGRLWRAVAQVSGRAIEKNPLLEAGALVKAGTVLVRIDPQEYELAVAELEASLKKIDADLAALAVRENNTKASLEIEKEALGVYKAELERLQGLRGRDAATLSDVDEQKGRTLAQQARVQDLENSLRVIPSDRLSLASNQKASEAKLASARLAVAHTVIRAPFDCRIASVDFEETQFISTGQVLAEAHGIAVAELAAQVSIATMKPLVPAIKVHPALFDAAMAGDDLMKRLGLEAVVRMRLGDVWVEWPARVDRIRGTLDAETRTLGVVVAVDRPYEKVKPGERPPLIKGMFCEVELKGPAKKQRVLIPRSALHGKYVYLAEEGRLRRREVRADFYIQNFVCLAEGLAGGETLVVSDLIPAIDGMLLDVQPDDELQAQVKAAAAGEVPLR